MIKVHGVQLSPFVRKVLLTLEYKGIEHESLPVFPASEDASFRAISPLGKIPVLEHDGFAIPDSSMICRYLDRVFPEKPVYPEDPQAEAKATWLEEFADTKLMDACAGLFQQRWLYPKMFGQETDEAVVSDILENKMPPLLDYLESVVPDSGLFPDDGVSIADISIATCFLQAEYGSFAPDAKRHPKLSRYLETVNGLNVVQNRRKLEKEMAASMAA